MLFLDTFFGVLVAICLVLFLYIKNQPKANIICGVYRKNVSFSEVKYAIALILIKLRQFQSKRKNAKSKIEELDKPQPLSYHKNAIDAVYFNGSSRSKSILTCGVARRKNNLVNGFLYLRIPKFSDKLLSTPRLPDTCMRQVESDEGNFSAEGLKLTPIEPMKVWKISYNGDMKFEGSNELFPVKLEATFRTRLKSFNYDTDMDPKLTAEAISKENWSKEYFETTKQFHQTHYEQYGDIEGEAFINGEKYFIEMPSVRDHSFGFQRNWKVFHRYLMHFLTLENGDRITVGVISIPITFSTIYVGFLTKANENKNYPIQSCDLQLYQHGENGIPPKDYAFRFFANNKEYVVKVNGYLAPEFYLGEEAECRIVEMYCTFNVNGTPGYGAAESQYRNLEGLPKSIKNE